MAVTDERIRYDPSQKTSCRAQRRRGEKMANDRLMSSFIAAKPTGIIDAMSSFLINKAEDAPIVRAAFHCYNCSNYVGSERILFKHFLTITQI